MTGDLSGWFHNATFESAHVLEVGFMFCYSFNALSVVKLAS